MSVQNVSTTTSCRLPEESITEKSYRASQGDTLALIAQATGIPENSLAQANPQLAHYEWLAEGDVVVLPAVDADATRESLPNQDQGNTFTVKKDTDEVKMRNEVLKSEPFNFTDRDIEIYTNAGGRFGYVVNSDTGKPFTEAELKAIKGSNVNVTLDQRTVDGLRNFQTIRGSIESSVAGIQDQSLRDYVRENLLRMSVGTDATALAAEDALVKTAAGAYPNDPGAAAAITNALTALAAHPGNANNPVAKLAVLRVEANDRANVYGPPDVEGQAKLREQLVALAKQSGGFNSQGSVVGRERPVDANAARQMNLQVAESLRGLGDENGAKEREYIARLWGATPEERMSGRGLIDAKLPPRANSVSAPTPLTADEQRLKDINAELSRNTPADSRDSGKLSDFKAIPNDPTMYYPNPPSTRGSRAVAGGGAVIAIAKTTLDFIAADRKMSLIAEKYKLQEKISGPAYIETPMRPEEVRLLKRQLASELASEKNPTTREGLKAALKWVALMEEASHAFHGPRK